MKKKDYISRLVRLDGFGYYCYADGPIDDAPALAAHVAKVFDLATKCPFRLGFLRCKCGSGEAIALYHSDLSAVNVGWFPRADFGVRPKAGAEGTWEFFRFFRDAGPDGRRALRSLFGGLADPPSRFVLSGILEDT